MKKPALIATTLVLALMAAGCRPQPAVTPVPAAPTAQAAQGPADSVAASAVVAPVRESQLSFVISGLVKELGVEEGQPVQAGQKLLVLEAPALEYAVLQAEAALRAAEFEYRYWVPPRFDRPPERRQLAEQELIQVRRALDTARAELTQATLVAPFDGTIVSIRIAQGELVQPGQIVLRLADLDHLQIKTTDLSERDLPEVQIGQSATIFVEALGEEFTGSVVLISPMADTVGGDAVYQVTLELDTRPANLLWGMSAEVNIAAQ